MRKTVFIFSDGKLKRKQNTVFFETTDGNKRYLPIQDIGEIMVFGEIVVNKRLLEFLAKKEVILHYFNYYGYYIGSYYPREHLNSGYMILRQAEHYLDHEKRMLLARQFVFGAAQNMIQVLKYYERRGRPIGDIRLALEELTGKIDDYHDTDELMGLEGNMRNLYYQALDAIVDNPLFTFEKRTRRPPRNHMNTLISFGNSILYTTILSEIYKTHLDPRIGFLHATNFRRFTLNLDIAEIFKPIIVDRTIFTLIGRNQLTEADFESEMGGILLKESGRKTFVTEMDRKLSTTLMHQSSGRNVSYRRLLRLELYKLQKCLMGEESYIPYQAKW
ncbi:MAG: type I-B CRISPR-associated endonuclease Cas1 [Firmicutes bacterium]|nr:type I-B CRISPR-associated endonuclease Cas1 [Bacillota bacterium]